MKSMRSKSINKSINNKSKKQCGGTLLGMIIGLVVGLGIAVAVAVMITKTSSPFTNKLGMTKAPEEPVIQLTDPNKPLYGNSFKEPPPDSESAVNNRSTENENPLLNFETAIEASQAETNASPKSSVKPIDAGKNNADEKAAYYLQVGAFRDEADAENVRAKLALLGIESSVSRKNPEGDGLYRVRIGPFDHMDALNRMRSKLSENSIDVAVIKTPK